MLLALVKIPSHLGYLAVAALVGGESMGIPLPGETALIVAGLAAGRGKLDIVAVIAVASAAAIIGDNLGYLIGRAAGRRLLTAPGPFETHRRMLLDRGEPFFARHGPKAVFLGRWFAGLRIGAAWLAGINRMRWSSFLVWNALGGLAWATSVGLLAYAAGPAAESALKTFGIAGLALAALVTVAWIGHARLRRRRAVAEAEAGAELERAGAVVAGVDVEPS